MWFESGVVRVECSLTVERSVFLSWPFFMAFEEPLGQRAAARNGYSIRVQVGAIRKEQSRIVVKTVPQVREVDVSLWAKGLKVVVRTEGITVKVVFGTNPREDAWDYGVLGIHFKDQVAGIFQVVPQCGLPSRHLCPREWQKVFRSALVVTASHAAVVSSSLATG